MFCNKFAFILKNYIYVLCILVLFTGLNACTGVTSASEESKKTAATTTFQLEPFILNIPNRGAPKFLKICIVLDLVNVAMVETAKAKQAPMRDAIIGLMSSKSSEDFLSPEGKIQLKEELMIRINQILKEGAVKNVYFTELVMQ
ncbi:MAG: flagellar basal body-associated FliL family protein [Nitrospirae bacterium]|nr:flagellar basal body-associated FliL family protein [Nitrospirota bacterium]